MQQTIPEIRSSDDPRLNIPSVTLSEIHSLGCLFHLLNILPVVPVLYGIAAQNIYLLINQGCILITVILWISNLLFNNAYVKKVQRISRPGQASLVDKFIDRSTESTKKTLVYMFNHQGESGGIQKLQARCSVVSQELFDSPIGSKLFYYSMPHKNRFLTIANYHPFSWLLATPDHMVQDLQRWTRISSRIMLGTSLLAIWTRASLLAIGDLRTGFTFTDSLLRFSYAFFSPTPLQYLLTVITTVPTLPLVSVIALLLTMRSMVQFQE